MRLAARECGGGTSRLTETESSWRCARGRRREGYGGRRVNGPSETSHYARASVELRQSLVLALPPEALRTLQRRRPWRHVLVLARVVCVLTASTAGAAMLDRWSAWLPC